MSTEALIAILKEKQETFAALLPYDFNVQGVAIDLSDDNQELRSIDSYDTAGWEAYIWQHMKNNGALLSAGGYREKRSRYGISDIFFEQGQQRIFHMGIDIWVERGTPLFSPLQAKIHSFQNNQNYLDYGPTIILSHQLEGIPFHTLYGHLTLQSLEGIKEGQIIETGQRFASVGEPPTNGNWPPHVHFQIIIDMRGLKGDFQAIAAPFQFEDFCRNCPDPNLLLAYRALETA